jgi:hypothetical protein
VKENEESVRIFENVFTFQNMESSNLIDYSTKHVLKLLPLYYYGPYTPFANPLVCWINNPSPQCTSFNLVRAIPPVTSGCPVTLFMTFSMHFSFSPIPTHQLEKMDCTK